MTQATALVLQAVSVGHRYGFDIMDATGLASGTVFPILRRLEGEGLLRGRWENISEAHRNSRPQRRLYELTGTGSEALARAEAKLARTRGHLDGLLPSKES
jgi:DNA-binding PadR family transcriptional regulator